MPARGEMHPKWATRASFTMVSTARKWLWGLPFGLVALLGLSALDPVKPALAIDVASPKQAPVQVVWFPDPPYTLDEHGVPTGFEIDLWRIIAETQQIPYQIRQVNRFKDLLDAVTSGEADIAIGGIMINENRSKKFVFTPPTATSSMRIYERKVEEATAIKVLKAISSREVVLIFLGLIVIAGFFALPVWLLERDRSGISSKSKREELIYFVQKTLLLSSDHTKRSITRLLSIASLFARVLLTAYFTTYILKIVTAQDAKTANEASSTTSISQFKNKMFASMPSTIQASMLTSAGIRQTTCWQRDQCVLMLQAGQVDAILDDVQSMKMRLAAAAPEPKITPTSGPLMTMFMAYGLSKKFSQDPRATTINDAISRSYYNGTHAALSRTWLSP